uniref:Secreted protein n=1 Tax=Ixodes ricinus TaxID=34613 RepID=A0A6B0V067_IXORI
MSGFFLLLALWSVVAAFTFFRRLFPPHDVVRPALILGAARLAITFARRLLVGVVVLVSVAVVVLVGLAVTVPVATLDHAHELLDHQERQDAGENPEPHAHVVGAVSVAFVSVVVVSVAVGCVVLVAVRHQGVRDEVEERVAQQSARSEAEQHLEQRFVARPAVDRDKEEDHERRDADEQR